MKKHLTAGRIARYLLCLGVICTLILGVTYARYVQEVQGQGSASVAAVALDLTSDGAAVDLTSKLQGMRPGESREVEFAVSNKKATTVSEVTLEYSVAIATTGNLPLTYALAAKSSGSVEGSFVQPTGSGSPLAWTGGVLPFGPSAVGTVHNYVLTVTWPAGEASESLAYEIDRVILKVDAQQAQPREVVS